MAVFGIETDRHALVTKYINDTEHRLKSHNFVKNPFKGKVGRIDSIGDSSSTYVLVVDPLYPPFYYIGFIAFVLAYSFTGFSWWTFPGAVLSGTAFFWTKWPPVMGAYAGLRKTGYKGKFKVLSNSDIIRRMLK